MWKGRYRLGQMMEQTAHSAELAICQTIIEIAGDKRVLIENHQGVTAYGKEKILVNVRYGCVCICGSQLEMMHMTKDQLVIYGAIYSVTLQRRERS